MEDSANANEYTIESVPVELVPASELRLRARRVQALMREEGLDGVLATHNADMLYLSGVVQQGQVYLPAEGEPLLMVRKHLGRAQASTALPSENVIDVRSLRQMPELITGGGESPRRIGFTFDTLPVATFNAYTKALSGLGAEWVDTSLLVRKARAIKSEWEVEHVRRAAQVVEAGLQAAREHLREGVTEVEVAAQVEAAMRVAGHSGTMRFRAYGQEMHMGHLLAGEAGALPSFMNSPTGGIGLGPSSPYGASIRPIGRGEPVFLDYCGEWSGYIADQTRMLSVGPLSLFWYDAYAAMRDVLAHLEERVRPGMTSGELYGLALARATELGYGENFLGPPEEESPGQRVPFVGHGVGLELDEWPPLQRGTEVTLEAGMVLAIEPKLIFTGRGAIGLEDTFLLTETGLEPLTFSSREIVEV